MVLEFGLIKSGLFESSSVSGEGMGADKSQVIWNDVGIGIVPIGAIVAWVKSLAGTPSLLPSFVECNGQVLADGDSPLNGRTIPNLNASGGGTKRFLRGSTTSGTTGGTETHTHTEAPPVGSALWSPNTNTLQPANHLPPYYEVVWVMRIK